MPRRSKDGEAFVQILMVGPWWLPLPLALGAWLCFSELLPWWFRSNGGPIAEGFGTLASSLAWVPTAMVLLLGVISWIKRAQRGGLARAVAAGASLDALDWQEFEHLSAEALRRAGFTVVETPSGPDGGVDVVAQRNGEKFAVQCKHWKRRAVGVRVARELLGAAKARKDAGAILITSGPLTRDAERFCAEHDVLHIGQAELVRTLEANALAPKETETSPSPATPTCPKCDGPMTLRTARKGSRAGQQFLGCTAFPDCRGTRNVAPNARA